MNRTKILVLGASGKTGRRVAQRLAQDGIDVRRGSRSAATPFDWNDENTWAGALADITAVYISYAPDLAIPGATESLARFVGQATASGVQKLVLLSGRGEAEAQACESIVQESGADWTIVRASWFNQNFSEGAFTDMIAEDVVALPVAGVREPFVDAEDIADVAYAALTEDHHAGEIYEVTGPRLMTFAEAIAEISDVTERRIHFESIPREAFNQGVAASGAPSDIAWLMDYLFSTVLDGRNAYLADGVQRALGRAPRDFKDYVKDTAAAGSWRLAAG